jgi:hypothetical protein
LGEIGLKRIDDDSTHGPAAAHLRAALAFRLSSPLDSRMIAYYSNLLHRTWLGLAVGGRVPWLGPLFDVLHFIGMALVVGCAAILDLRLLGVARSLPVAPLRRLFPWAVAGFLLNAVTGVGFYSGNPGQYQNWVFGAKMVFVALAVLNTLWMYAGQMGQRLQSIGSGEDAPPSVKLAAASSLALWLGVMLWGRLLPSFAGS